MKKKGTPLGKFEFDKIFLSGSEIFALYKMYDDSNNKKKLRISTDEDNEFKRNYDEWEPEKIDSYIKSIADDFPHTPMYVLEDKETQEWYVVDGQHRMTTIINYLGNSNIGLIQFENVKNSEETNTFYEVYKNLFEIVIIKSKYSVKNQKTEFFNQLEDIFFRLNNTANPINEYLFYKSIFSKKNRIKTKKLEKSFNEFQKIKTENPNKVFERLVRIALMISKDINEIKKIDSLSKAYREYIFGRWF